jgi:class 3 adenylate cyclase/CHASE2 domain-containing sensor protein
MKHGVKAIKKHLAALIVLPAVFLITGAAYFFGLFDYLEHKTYDFRVLLLAESSKPSDDIVLVLLDQNSIDWASQERGWPWPWPRTAYADFVDYMNLGGAKSISFDVIFSEPSIYRNARQDEIIDSAVKGLETARALAAERQAVSAMAPLLREVAAALQELSGYEDDASFIRAEGEFGRVVQTVFFSRQTGNMLSWPGDLDKPLFEPDNFGDFLSNFDLRREEGDVKAQFPIPGLRNAAGVLGNITGIPDSDGIFRRNRLFTLFDGKAVPGLGAAALLASGRDGRIRYDPKKRAIEWGEYVIPVDRDGKSLLRFRGSLDRYIPYSIGDILKSAEAHAKGEEPLLYPEDFKDKYVFFGYYAPGLYDIFSTPIDSVYPGVGMHITMLDNILQQDFIRECSPALGLLVSLAAIVLMGLLVFYSGRIPLAIGGGVVILALISGGAFGAYAAGYWIPMVAPIAGVLLVFLAGTLYNYATEGSQKRFIKSAFSQYLSPAVIEQIIADPSKLELGGESRDMTAIFTDIQRFSSISEGLQKAYERDGPKELVNLLNLYLTEMSDIVLANHGTIDKFEGDAIIAFFGAPIYTEKHAALACRTAVQMKRAEAEMIGRIMDPAGRFNPVLGQLIAKGAIRAERPLYTRVGINSGEMVVGNMGTPNKMDYTIMGNAVNLAARLEGVNKQYDTGGILLSEYTKDKLKEDEFVLRPLSRVRVVGISTPLRLYELLDLRENAPAELLDKVKNWEAALRTYEDKNFPEALAAFTAISQGDAQDLTAKLYIGRCEQYLKAPPSDEDWDNGVDNLTSK